MRLIADWLLASLRHRLGKHVGAALGVALSVALLTALLGFIDGASRSMTARAIATVPVDWQVQLNSGVKISDIVFALQAATPTAVVLEVGYADVASMISTSDGTVQTTGAGKVLGLPSGYDAALPGQIRPLLGSAGGVLLAQQTAANLHATIGSTVSLERPGLDPIKITVTGIVDLPNQDSMFQAAGLPANSLPQAPPDNVLLVPIDQWHALFDAQAVVRPESVKSQLHVRLDRSSLLTDPSIAYADVLGRARNLEARIAGSGIVADNLAARLQAARADSLYARVLFLFLGAPGIALAVLLTFAVSACGEARRRREQALLKLRGATSSQIMRLAAAEAIVIAIAGSINGLLLAKVATDSLRHDVRDLLILGAFAGLALALTATLIPAWRSLRQSTVASVRGLYAGRPVALWQRLWLDAALLSLGLLVFWYNASGNYQVVLASEGVAQAAVDYSAFLAPLCAWLGAGLLTMRLLTAAITGNQNRLTTWMVSLGGNLKPLVSCTLSRRSRALARAGALAALAVGFAVSTSVFNATFNAQTRVDAQLTNGADVTVTGTIAHPAGDRLTALKDLPGVVAAEPMRHQFAYVGADLQDLYGIDPVTIGRATPMANAYFGNGDARQTLLALSLRPDGLLVSDETVKDFQLNPGDTVNLRLQNASDHQYHVVPFRFVGVAREFPTAPHDSFLVANSDYIAKATGSSVAETVLLRTNGDAETVAGAARKLVAARPGVRVTSLGEAQRLISASLTAVDLGGLSKLELSFAIAAVVGVTGLLFALDIAERRRGFAALALIGAQARDISDFLWSEAVVVVATGLLMGSTLGLGIAYMLVAELQGVFDPPPEVLSLPWAYLAVLLVSGVTVAVAVVGIATLVLCTPKVEALRYLG